MSQHIVFLDRDSVRTEVHRPSFKHTYKEYSSTLSDQVVSRLQHATIVIICKISLNEKMLAQLPKLKLIAIAATGYDCIDILACQRYGIAVINIRNYATHAVPEHVFMMVLALRRNLLLYRQDVEDGMWQKSEHFCFFGHSINDLFGSTIGIIGEGETGKGTAKIARAFGMHVLFSDHASPKKKNVKLTSFEQILIKSDVISLHCPLTTTTRGLIGINELRKMKRNVLLINTARGGLVNEEALIHALDEGLIAGAGFDVITNEPPTNDHPLLRVSRSNFILTPHIAWASDEALRILATQLISNIEAWVAGNQYNLIV